MVFGLSPRKLTRLVEQARKWMQRVVLVSHAIGAPQDDPDAGTDRELRTYRHLEQLSDRFSAGSRHSERIRGDRT